MGASSGITSKQHWQKQIDNYQARVNNLKKENARDRETIKNNNSKRNVDLSKTYRARIAQRTEEIKKLQEQIKGLKAFRSKLPNNSK